MKLRVAPYSAFLHLALIALSGMVFFLMKENRQLKNPYRDEGLEIGQMAPAVVLTALDGASRTLDFQAGGEKDKLLFVFTTTCPACKANQDSWRTLHDKAGDSVEIVGISLDDDEATRAYRDAFDLPFSVAVADDRDLFAESFEISAVPVTIRIGSDGKVRGSWLGTLSDDQLPQISPEIVDRG